MPKYIGKVVSIDVEDYYNIFEEEDGGCSMEIDCFVDGGLENTRFDSYTFFLYLGKDRKTIKKIVKIGYHDDIPNGGKGNEIRRFPKAVHEKFESIMNEFIGTTDS